MLPNLTSCLFAQTYWQRLIDNRLPVCWKIFLKSESRSYHDWGWECCWCLRPWRMTPSAFSPCHSTCAGCGSETVRAVMWLWDGRSSVWAVMHWCDKCEYMCHLSVHGCMACLTAGVVSVVCAQGRVLQRAMRAGGGGATAAVWMTQALAVLLMHLKFIDPYIIST